MQLSYDEEKRQKNIAERGLDFADAKDVFEGDYFELLDDRKDYGEERFIVFGEIESRPVCVVWTPRDGTRRIISMRYAHDEELEAKRRALD